MGTVRGLLTLVVLLSATTVAFADEKDRHRVKGKIDFSYSYQEAVSRAEKDRRPIFAYFTYET